VLPHRHVDALALAGLLAAIKRRADRARDLLPTERSATIIGA
jgi:hypothetical protein